MQSFQLVSTSPETGDTSAFQPAREMALADKAAKPPYRGAKAEGRSVLRSLQRDFTSLQAYDSSWSSRSREGLYPALPRPRMEPTLPRLRIEPVLPMLRMLPALPMLNTDPTLPRLRMEPALRRLPTLRKLRMLSGLRALSSLAPVLRE